MKKIFTILIIFNLQSAICSLNAQWVQQTSGVTTPLYNVEFVNINTGWATGNSSVILKTTNSGVNWFSQTIDLGYPKNLYGLDMLDAYTGYIAGWFETILKTTNGGINWLIISNIPSNNGNSNHSVSFINSETGWVTSSLGRVLRTTNGGISWDSVYTGTGVPLLDIQFLNTLTGWACGDGGTLIKSTNGGLNWISLPLLTGANLPGLHFIGINTGWVVSEQSNMVFKTTNGGTEWDTVAVLPGGSLQYSYTIYFTGAVIGYIGGTYGRLFKTTNGGFNWAQQIVTIPMFIGNFSFFNDSTGWAVGGGGGIIHTTNGGTYVSISKNESEIPLNYKLYQNYPNPFNSTTIIEFEILKLSDIKLKLFDMLGRENKIMITQRMSPGKYLLQLDANELASGVYYYSLFADGKLIESKKMILSK
jgi:photosystem II stability/assembly factor-like uncharacterized protein